ncbi:MAG: alkaline shock response membrane anchor protein AmaP [Bacillota bacterium]
MQAEKTYKILFALLLFILSFIALGLAVGWTTPLTYLDNFLRGTNERWVLGILGLIGTLISLAVIRTTFRSKIPSQTEVVVTQLGKIKITISALESMAGKVAKQINGVKDAKPIIKCTPTGIAVFMQIFLSPDIHIPDTTTKIQNQVREYFSKVAGIEVEEVRILVTKLTSDIKNRVE